MNLKATRKNETQNEVSLTYHSFCRIKKFCCFVQFTEVHTEFSKSRFLHSWLSARNYYNFLLYVWLTPLDVTHSSVSQGIWEGERERNSAKARRLSPPALLSQLGTAEADTHIRSTSYIPADRGASRPKLKLSVRKERVLKSSLKSRRRKQPALLSALARTSNDVTTLLHHSVIPIVISRSSVLLFSRISTVSRIHRIC